eukprot:g10257.t1
MQDDIAESYRRMQSSPQRVIYSEVPAEIVGSHGDGDAQQTFHAEDRDFELSEGIGTYKASAASAPAPAAPAPQAETPPADTSEGDTYSLAAPAEPPAAAPPSQPAAEQTQQSGDQQPNETQPAAGGEANGDAPKASEELPAVDHSVATGGDALLEVALQEEAEQKKRRKHRRERRKIGPRSETGLLVFCPNGHRVEVQERHRGLTGRCPKCRSPFFVPPKPVEEKPAEDGAAEADAAESTAAGKYEQWMTDVRVHAVNPERLKLKANSLKNEFRLFDLGFAPDELLAGSFTKKKGTAGATSKKRLADREAMIEGLREGKTPDDTPLVEATSLTVEHAQQVRVVQPAAYAHESMFAGIEVFGERLIAVRIPTADENAPLFISFPLSEFRRFAELMSQYYSVQDLGTDCGVPMTDTFTEGKRVQDAWTELEQFLRAQHDVEIVAAEVTEDLQIAGLDADLVITLGGDGAILRACRQLGRDQLPLMGINLGRLGFLADLSPEEFCEKFDDIRNRNFRVVNHLMFECRLVRSDGTVETHLGLNEVAVSSAASLRMIDIELSIDGKAVTTYGCDGLIVSTPTGSTAHSLSAGGPILRQDLQAFVITPICPHTLTNRPLVDSADCVYSLRLPDIEEGVMLVVDGQIKRPLAEGDVVEVAKASVSFQLAKIPGNSYYKTLHRKLGWGGQPRYPGRED